MYLCIFYFILGGGGGGAVPRLCLHAVQIPYSGHVIMREVNVKIKLHKKIKVCGIQPVILNTKTAIKRRLIDVFKTLIDSMRNLIVLNCSDFILQYAFKCFLCLFCAANIEEENIIYSYAA